MKADIHMQRRIQLCVIVLLGLVMTERPVQAYVDPGAGILLWQGLAAGFLAILFRGRRLLGWAIRKRGDRS
jgi:hypothetical protein